MGLPSNVIYGIGEWEENRKCIFTDIMASFSKVSNLPEGKKRADAIQLTTHRDVSVKLLCFCKKVKHGDIQLLRI